MHVWLQFTQGTQTERNCLPNTKQTKIGNLVVLPSISDKTDLQQYGNVKCVSIW